MAGDSTFEYVIAVGISIYECMCANDRSAFAKIQNFGRYAIDNSIWESPDQTNVETSFIQF
jgi:hypothetical protein